MKKKSRSVIRKNSPKNAKKVAKTSEPKAQSNAQRGSFPVVAIGASAGGVEASSQLLKSLPANLGMAYVFVHHLSRSYDSHLTEILQRHTPMAVTKVTEGVKVEPNNVYVIPPDRYMSIEDHHLQLRKRSKTDVHAIDYFMNTLATSYQHNAIGVLLSGTAYDGTIGLKSIKLEGGITFAQDESAKHGQMPGNAAESGYVDYVLSPERIAEELSALIRHRFAVSSPNEELAKHEKEIKKILSIVLEKFDVDFFSHYKRTTVNRRILRRMAINNINDFDQYTRKLRNDERELTALYNDFLINVTSFFREPSFYNSLKKTVFPQLVKDRRSSDAIRLWVPGCATGEEAYSTAITLTEYLESKKISMPVQVFATDLDEKAIARARVGIYSRNAVAEISTSRLEKYFQRIDGHYQIDKSIRDMCVFSVHNLMKDPPFSRIDLVSCQNVLIYIEASPQRKILQAFHYALKPNGFLMLGKSETVGNAADLFEAISNEVKLYGKKQQAKITAFDFSIRSHPISIVSKLIPDQRTVADVENEFDKLLLTKYVPASVLVNKDLEILRFRGQTTPFFQPSSGKASLNLLKMLREELVFEVRGLFQKARKSSGVVSKDGIALDSTNQVISIEMSPIKSGKDLYYLVIFQVTSVGEIPVKRIKVKKGDHQARIAKLEQALKDARNQLRTTTEDFDVAREELQSANEEILSSNEELQSINEELETSKEELQSANEELTTINEELQNRVEELKESHDYVQAILETMHGPLMVVNQQMRIKTANNAFYEFFKLDREETEGNYVSKLVHGQWEIPSLAGQLKDLRPRKSTFKNFEITHVFPNLGERVMLINAHLLETLDNGSQILLAFQDITEFRKSERKLKEAQQQLKLALEGGAVGTWSWNIKTNVISGSNEEAVLFGLEENSFFQTFAQWEQAIYPDDRQSVRQELDRAITKRDPLDIEFRINHRTGRVRWLLSKANVYLDQEGNPEMMMGVNIDITERKQAIEALQESEKRFHTLSDQAPVMIWMADEDQQCNFVNKTWLNFSGRTFQQELGTGWYDGLHPDDKQDFIQKYRNAAAAKKAFKTDYRLRRYDGDYRWILAHGVPRYTNSETFIGYIGTCIDITDRIDLEKQKDDFMGIASHELKTPVTSIKAYAQILHEKFKKANDEASASMLGRLDNQIDKLTNLINTLLDVARIQSGQMEYDVSRFEIRPFVEEVVEEMQRTSSKHKINIDVQLENGASLTADRARMGQVMNNLISNAIKYSAEGTSIIVSAKRELNNFIFSVKDVGVGIEKNMHDKIFERFYRVTENSGNRVSGLGLGLFISSRIVRQQGGKIWVESEPNKGSTFYFSLPVDGQ
jgi:two-component system CheB/CheR fusion protein